jgi:hypothetical protein
MDQEIRNKLRNVVTRCRELLEDSVSDELEGKYAIFTKKDQVTADPDAAMTHLTEEEQAARKDILDHFGHIKARGFKPKEALDQLVREIAFTHLNRLCAYKMMEAREVYVGGQKFREAVSRGVNSNGVKWYLADHPEEERLFNTGHQDVAYRHFLDWLGNLLSDEIGILFNPNDPANRLYPRQKTLNEVLDLLNGGAIKADETELRQEWPKVWSEDETIGWVYQYFTPKDVRDRARKESPVPRNSYELAFRNQFFTPRYVVEFLTDNTLGRMWYEMRKGDTKLKDECRSMVRRPIEIFLNEREQLPTDPADTRQDLSRAELLKLPIHIPHRAKKDPRELTILDPACGSGHFLLYCFDLLVTIYEEAYTDPELGPVLQKHYPKLEDFRRDVPRLILAHNVHGIDIDLRCSQIAALALWLRCQRAFQEMGLNKDRPKITRSNFVCAEPMPGEEQMLKECVRQIEPKLLGQVVEVVFEKMKLAGEAGSLLKIGEDIRDAVASAKKQWVAESTRATDRKGQPLLFTQAAMDRAAGKPEQASLFDLSGITDDQFFEGAEAKVVEALRQYAENAQNGRQLQRLLFSNDAVRGFAFVDLCHKRYDVVLMNPPFGSSLASTTEYLSKNYPQSYYDLYSAFVDRAVEYLGPTGTLGCITSKTFFAATRLYGFRQWLLTRAALTICADLGIGVLDAATVETAAYVVSRTPIKSEIVFLGAVFGENTEQTLASAIDGISTYTYIINPMHILAFPNASFSAYWGSDHFLELFRTYPSIDSSNIETAQGQATGDDFRFVRTHWEISMYLPGYWRPFAKGGNFFRYYCDWPYVVNWSDDAVKEYRKLTIRSVLISRRSKEFECVPALAWNRVNDIGFNVRVLPKGAKFSDKAPALVPKGDPLALLGILCSETVDRLCAIQNPNRMFEVRDVSRIPLPSIDSDNMAKTVSSIVTIKQKWTSRIEPSRIYVAPFAGLHLSKSITHICEALMTEWRDDTVKILELQQQVNNDVLAAYALSREDVAAMDHVWDTVLSESVHEDLVEETGWAKFWCKQILSYIVGIILGRWDAKIAIGLRPWPKLPSVFDTATFFAPGMLTDTSGPQGESLPISPVWEGIIVDDETHNNDIVRQVRIGLEAIWEGRAEAVETEICTNLGVNELREFFRRPSGGGFWQDHVERYAARRGRKAPIYWLLQSSRKKFAIWLYYHRLDKDLLFKALVNYVEPKIRLEASRLDAFRSQKVATGESARESKRIAKDLERQEDFLSELKDFEEKLRQAAELHLEPDLNDGVVLNIAPLWQLVPWKEAKNYWDELLKGEYEWSSIGKQLRQKGLVK